MSDVSLAAYDIMFWLHHCNIDRIYEKYIKDEPDSKYEFQAHQSLDSEDLFK